MNALEVMGLVLSAASIALAVLAIWQSMYFYRQGKGTETSVVSALAEIKAQTASLEKIAGRQLDRFTKAATQTRHPEESLLAVAKALTLITAPASPQLGQPNELNLQGQKAELIASYIPLAYFAGIANLLAGAGLQQMQPVEEGYPELSAITEQTFVFFQHIRGVIQRVNRKELEENSAFSLLSEIEKDIAPQVANTAMIVLRRNAETEE